MVDQAVYGCKCPEPKDSGNGRWTHEWLESCPIHGPYVRGELTSSAYVITRAVHDALCDGGEEQYDVHVTHDDKVQRVLEAVTPLLEADVLGRVADIYEAEAADRARALGSYAALSYSAVAIVERLRYWRDNLQDLTRKDAS